MPIALSQLGYVVVQFADNAMVGSYGGDDPLPLSAVSFGVMMSFVLFSLAMGITLGLTPVIGEHFARGEYRRTAHYLQSSLVSYPILGVIFMALQQLSVPLLYKLGQPVEVVDMAVPYYKLMGYSLPAIMLYGCFKQFLEGMGNTVTPMVIAVVTNAMNIVLNWVFIYGNCGCEAMGVYGAGLATLIARWASPVLIFIYFVVKGECRDYLKLFSRGVKYIKDTYRLLTIGVPLAGQMLLEGSAFVVTSVMMGWFGAEALAANQVAMTYGNAAFMLTIALGSAATIRVSHCYGLGDREKMRDVVISSSHLSAVWGAMVFISFIAFRGVLPRLFTPSEPIIALASQMIVWVGLYQISDAVQGTLIGVLRGMQDVKIIAGLSFVAYVLLNIPVGYLCAFTFGFDSTGLLAGYVVGLTTAAIAYGIRVYRNLRSEKIVHKIG
ncbi:MAG: MATE family efflux transporter [Alistipes sp.]|nr:MATE family efflux transporter [Alistipes sp.]